ncbi:hypothetical protein KGF54_005087 [Candida jiufengensis]|uniref:uncharacterized protein n=1 Tax=Candida jiufengensis TaxID=497108 RepID=UPI0022245321|nr:uncharacterized protein KGF54_005087 [Candida jiufengensis]KAI5952012.1 hypothetical protein KGF54_005087 [Candida jiufengensis]
MKFRIIELNVVQPSLSIQSRRPVLPIQADKLLPPLQASSSKLFTPNTKNIKQYQISNENIKKLFKSQVTFGPLSSPDILHSYKLPSDEVNEIFKNPNANSLAPTLAKSLTNRSTDLATTQVKRSIDNVYEVNKRVKFNDTTTNSQPEIFVEFNNKTSSTNGKNTNDVIDLNLDADITDEAHQSPSNSTNISEHNIIKSNLVEDSTSANIQDSKNDTSNNNPAYLNRVENLDNNKGEVSEIENLDNKKGEVSEMNNYTFICRFRWRDINPKCINVREHSKEGDDVEIAKSVLATPDITTNLQDSNSDKDASIHEGDFSNLGDQNIVEQEPDTNKENCVNEDSTVDNAGTHEDVQDSGSNNNHDLLNPRMTPTSSNFHRENLIPSPCTLTGGRLALVTEITTNHEFKEDHFHEGKKLDQKSTYLTPELSSSDSEVEELKPLNQRKEEKILSAKYINNFKVDKKVRHRYKNFIRRRGVAAFLEKNLNDSVTKYDICKLILDLGYPKNAIKNHTIQTVNELAQVLIKLIMWDEQGDLNTVNRFFQQQYSLSNFIHDLRSKSNILVITGAGISTSLGIPDFRSNEGLYCKLKNLNLSDPQMVFDLMTFKIDPSIFYSIAHLILPPDEKLSLLHCFIKLLQDKEKLNRLYTQNVDNLEQSAGINNRKLVQCHGSFAKASCISCKNTIDGKRIYGNIREGQIPRCFACWNKIEEAPFNHGIYKPNITFFGENLPEKFNDCLKIDVQKCDLVLVIGTSLKVEPVSSIIDKIPKTVKKILINKDSITDKKFDLSLIGYCDEITAYLLQKLGQDWFIKHKDYSIHTKYKINNLGEKIIKISKKTT